MKRFLVRMRQILFERIRVLADDYGISINNMIIELLELGLKVEEEKNNDTKTHIHKR